MTSDDSWSDTTSARWIRRKMLERGWQQKKDLMDAIVELEPTRTYDAVERAVIRWTRDGSQPQQPYTSELKRIFGEDPPWAGQASSGLSVDQTLTALLEDVHQIREQTAVLPDMERRLAALEAARPARAKRRASDG